MKLFIPNILSYKGEKLTEENFDKFKKLINSGLGTRFTRVDANNKLQYVTFYWGDSDYPDYLTVKQDEYFMYNLEDWENYLIIDKIKEDWIILESD